MRKLLFFALLFAGTAFADDIRYAVLPCLTNQACVVSSLTVGGTTVSGDVPYSATQAGIAVLGTQTEPLGDKTILGTLTHSGSLANSVNSPTFGTLTTASTGGVLTGNTTYFYRVSSTTADGETQGNTETSKATAAGTNTNTITVVWLQATGATGYKIYGRTTGAEQLIGTVTSGTTLSFVDTGSVSPSGALPSSNSTGRMRAVLVNATTSLLVGASGVPVATANVSSAVSSGAPTAWGTGHFVVGGTSANVAGLALMYNTSADKGVIASLNPNTAWKPLVFNASSWVFASNPPTAAFTISGAGEITSTSTKMRGAIVLSGGTGTATVLSGAFCVCSVTSAFLACEPTVSGTTLTTTVTAGGSNTVNYICIQ